MKTIIALFLVLLCTTAQAVEYRVVRLRAMSTTETNQTKVLNEHAREGWRLVEVGWVGATAVDLYLVREEAKP